MAQVEFKQVKKSYGNVDVIHGVDLSIADGEFVVIVGPSSCGKSTLLRMVAGLEPITGGEILIDGKVVNNLEPKDRDIAFEKAQRALLATGITGIADMGTAAEDWASSRRAGDAGWLNIRIFSYSASVEPMLAIAAGEPTPWLYGDKLRMAGVKLYADGALGSRGAWLKQPYADKPGERGVQFLEDAKLRNLMSRAAMDGFQVAVHAIGDAANAQVLDSIAEMTQTYAGDRRWRIEHAQIVDPVDIPRFARLGVIASMEPPHAVEDKTWAEDRLGPQRILGAYAWRTLRRDGARAHGGGLCRRGLR